MASIAEASLLSELESPSCSQGIHSLFSDYLRPFSDLKNPKKTKKSAAAAAAAKSKADHQSLIRSLAKSFLPFLNRALSVLPKRLADPSKFGDEKLALEMFEIYRLCLNCLNSVASQLSCKPYSVQIQRVRMVHCLEAWGRYKEAEREGFGILEEFKGTDVGGKLVKREGKLLPDIDKGGGDKDFVSLVVEIVVTIVKCLAMGGSKDGVDYRKVIRLVEEVKPWFR